jgi:hypothetical protein
MKWGSAPNRSRWRLLRISAAVLAVMAGGAAYGFLVHARQIFPYELVKRARHGQRETTHSPYGLHAKRAPGSLSPLEMVQQLANLPYLQGYRPATPSGVIRINDRVLAQDGLNFFTSSHAPVATLMDMDGSIVKTWTADSGTALPGFVLDAKHRRHKSFLRDAELLPDGGIVAMFDEIGIVRLDSSSRVLWAWRGRVHHDLFVDEEGNTWAILREKRVVPALKREAPVLEDFVVELSPEGKQLRRISLIECFQRSPYATMLLNIPPRRQDIFHTNSVVVLDGTLASRGPAFRRGNLLVSIKRLNAVAVVDPDAGQVVWALRGQWYGQHSAKLSAASHLLLFDNLGTMRPASRALEVDPFTQQVLWSFGGRPGENLLSETVGFVERLSGGNTLITETNYGRVLEVTPDNRVVWEFTNPYRVGKNKELVAIVYFMERVSRGLPFLKGAAAGSPSGPRPSPPHAAPIRPERAGTPPRAAT